MPKISVGIKPVYEGKFGEGDPSYFTVQGVLCEFKKEEYITPILGSEPTKQGMVKIYKLLQDEVEQKLKERGYGEKYIFNQSKVIRDVPKFIEEGGEMVEIEVKGTINYLESIMPQRKKE